MQLTNKNYFADHKKNFAVSKINVRNTKKSKKLKKLFCDCAIHQNKPHRFAKKR